MQRSVGGRRASKSANSRRCPASRIGGPPGYALAERSSPTAFSNRDAWITVSQGASPRSIRPTSEPDSPAAVPRVSWLTPAIRRAVRTSAPIIRLMARPLRVPSSMARSRTGMAPSVTKAAYGRLSARLTRGAGQRGAERLVRASSVAI
jgi:hypothetical protein